MLMIAAVAAVAFVAVDLFSRRQKTQTRSQLAEATPYGSPALIDTFAMPGSDSWGWSYFDSGVSIAPDGTYYKGGVKVWAPS